MNFPNGGMYYPRDDTDDKTLKEKMQRHFCLIQALQEYTLNIELAERNESPQQDIDELKRARIDADLEF